MSDNAIPAMASVNADFWRCHNCWRLITKPEMDAACGVGGIGVACPCGSTRYQPANCPWYGFLMPRVIAFVIKRLRGRA